MASSSPARTAFGGGASSVAGASVASSMASAASSALPAPWTNPYATGSPRWQRAELARERKQWRDETGRNLALPPASHPATLGSPSPSLAASRLTVKSLALSSLGGSSGQPSGAALSELQALLVAETEAQIRDRILLQTITDERDYVWRKLQQELHHHHHAAHSPHHSPLHSPASPSRSPSPPLAPHSARPRPKSAPSQGAARGARGRAAALADTAASRRKGRAAATTATVSAVAGQRHGHAREHASHAVLRLQTDHLLQAKRQNKHVLQRLQPAHEENKLLREDTERLIKEQYLYKESQKLLAKELDTLSTKLALLSHVEVEMERALQQSRDQNVDQA